MRKYRVMVECRHAYGTDIHGWIVAADNPGEAGYIATENARAHYPEFDEFEPVKTEVLKNG